MRFATPPAGGLKAAMAHLEKHLGHAGVRRYLLGDIDLSALTLAEPHRLYHVDHTQADWQVAPLGAAVAGPWRYLLLHGDDPVAGVEMFLDQDGAAAFGQLRAGPIVRDSLRVLEQAEGTLGTRWEARFLHAPSIGLVSLWLTDGPTEDLVIPILAHPRGLEVGRSYTENELAEAIRGGTPPGREMPHRRRNGPHRHALCLESVAAEGAVLDRFSLGIQLHGHWCWAAVSAAVKEFYDGRHVKQCEVVNDVLAESRGSIDCCLPENAAGPVCNVEQDLEAVLEQVGHFDRLQYYHIFPHVAREEIEAGRPVVLRIQWNSGHGGHAVVVVGWSGTEGETAILLADPTYGLAIVDLSEESPFIDHYQSCGAKITATYFTH